MMSTACSSDQESRPAKSHQEAFEFYASLGPGRTYRQVAEKMGVSLPTVKRWSRENSWISRVDEREAQIARHAADSAISTAVEDIKLKRKLVKAALMRLGQAISQGKIKMQLSDLDRMIRLDALLQGNADGVLPVASIGAISVEEFRAYVLMTPPHIIEACVADNEERARLDRQDPEGRQRREDEDVELVRKHQQKPIWS